MSSRSKNATLPPILTFIPQMCVELEGLNVDHLWISVDTYLCPVKSTKILLSHAGTIVEQWLLWDAHHAVDFFVDNVMMSLKQHPPYVDANTFWHAGSFSHAHISLAWHALVTAFSWKVVAALLCKDSSASVLEECEGLHRLKLLKVGSQISFRNWNFVSNWVMDCFGASHARKACCDSPFPLSESSLDSVSAKPIDQTAQKRFGPQKTGWHSLGTKWVWLIRFGQVSLRKLGGPAATCQT